MMNKLSKPKQSKESLTPSLFTASKVDGSSSVDDGGSTMVVRDDDCGLVHSVVLVRSPFLGYNKQLR
ncbi:uncharacterized protein G2W53_010245 [Senna tora]|uniref:Uncharacterized protein n=1 Tax=Senna tora TaxID=362788 RepID=A0A834WZJ1_9FABA|nr:uncharacterized protein G2W53_010245 [Senna tora]